MNSVQEQCLHQEEADHQDARACTHKGVEQGVEIAWKDLLVWIDMYAGLERGEGQCM